MRVFVLLHLRHLDGSGDRKILGIYTAQHEVAAARALLSAADVGGQLTVEEHEVRSAGLYGGSAKPIPNPNAYGSGSWTPYSDQDPFSRLAATQALMDRELKRGNVA